MRVAGWVGRRLLPLTVAAGDGALAVSWAAPASPGSAAITAYDIRYILTSADETNDANWSVVEDICTGAGSLAYTLSDLSNAAQHDVQVRAVSSAGDGHWSPTTAATPPTTGTPGTPPPRSPLAPPSSGPSQTALTATSSFSPSASPRTSSSTTPATSRASWATTGGMQDSMGRVVTTDDGTSLYRPHGFLKASRSRFRAQRRQSSTTTSGTALRRS